MLTISVGPSRRLAVAVAGMHGFAAAMFWLVPAPLWLAALPLPFLLGSAGYILRRDCFRTLLRSLVALRLHDDCRCEFRTRGGSWCEAVLLGSSFVSPYLTVLNLRPAGSRFAAHFIILSDAVNAEDFRRLRIWLKWRCSRMA